MHRFVKAGQKHRKCVSRHLKAYQDGVYRMMLRHHSRDTRNSNRNINKPQSNMSHTREDTKSMHSQLQRN